MQPGMCEELHLLGVRLALLQAEKVGLHARYDLLEALIQAGADPIHVPRNDSHGNDLTRGPARRGALMRLLHEAGGAANRIEVLRAGRNHLVDPREVAEDLLAVEGFA